MTNNKLITVFFSLALTIVVVWLLKMLQFVFLPLVLATFVAFLLNPLVMKLTRIKVPHPLAVTVAVLVGVLAVYLLGTIVSTSLTSFQRDLPRYERKIQDTIDQVQKLTEINVGPLTNQRLRRELNKWSVSPLIGYVVGSFLTLASLTLFTFVFTIYFLAGTPKLPHKIRQAFPPALAETINQAIENITDQVQKFIMAKTLTSFITGGMMVVVCLLFGVDFAITWGFFMFLLNWIPTIGVLAACVPPPVLLLIATGNWPLVFWLVVVEMIVFQTLGTYIEPKILGDSVNLSPLVALLALIFWGWIWGPAGMIVGVPVTALLKFTFDNLDSLRPVGALMGGKSRSWIKKRNSY
jgi:predicted PurR-regulated permease PerM